MRLTPDVCVATPPLDDPCESFTIRHLIRAGRPSMVQFQFPSHHSPESIPACTGEAKSKQLPVVIANAKVLPFNFIVLTD